MKSKFIKNKKDKRVSYYLKTMKWKPDDVDPYIIKEVLAENNAYLNYPNTAKDFKQLKSKANSNKELNTERAIDKKQQFMQQLSTTGSINLNCKSHCKFQPVLGENLHFCGSK